MVDINVNVFPAQDVQEILRLQREQAAQTSLLQSKLDSLLTHTQEMDMTLAEIKDRLTALQTAVQNETTVEQSAVTLLQGLTTTIGDLRQQLADAITTNSPADLQAVADGLDTLSASVQASTADLASAVTANTPATT